MKTPFYDLIILGAGFTGMILALRLANKGIDVCLVDKNKTLKSKIDKRTTAISKGSTLILEEIGAWKELKKDAQKIKKIIVSEGISENHLKFNSSLANSDSMGYIVENSLFKKVLEKLIKKNTRIKKENNFDVINLELPTKENNKVILKTKNRNLSCGLLIGADGRYSKTRFHAEISYYFHDYEQSAYIFNLKHEKPHLSTALERFFPSGPLAILPMKSKTSNQSSVVWTVENEFGDMSKFKKKQFIFEFNKKYKIFFGKIIDISKPTKFSLNIFSCYDCYNNGIVLVGDACQSLHPIAGQGFNLGLRDVNALSKLLYEAKTLGMDFNELVLQKYSNKRVVDKFLLTQATHNLNKLFSFKGRTISLLRSFGLNLFGRSTLLKKQSILYAMGLKNFEI